MIEKQLVIIGGGPAGLAAAIAAKESGLDDILVLERERFLGGILNQCIHNGFGLHTFSEELTGPEYAERYITRAKELGIEAWTEAMVLSLNSNRELTVVGKDCGVANIRAGAVILACGCRERPRGGVNIAGTRPSGIFSAGTAQKLVNIEGLKVGSRAVVLGSGDIGLIMARRMTFEGAKVEAVLEIMPYSSGLNRNVVQCLDDFGIPLYFNRTVIKIEGRERLQAVVTAEVDENRKPIAGTEKRIECDTLLLSVGLLPENELGAAAGVECDRVTGGAAVDDNFMTNIDGVFACGNVLHVHDLVDYVSSESAAAGKAAAEYLFDKTSDRPQSVRITACGGVRYTVPQLLRRNRKGALTLRMRVDGVYRKAAVIVEADGVTVLKKPRPIVTPGEMETLTLTDEQAGLLQKAERVTVSLKKGDKQ